MDLRKTVSGGNGKNVVCEEKPGSVERQTRNPKEIMAESRDTSSTVIFLGTAGKGLDLLRYVFLICRMEEINWIGQRYSYFSLAAESFLFF